MTKYFIAESQFSCNEWGVLGGRQQSRKGKNKWKLVRLDIWVTKDGSKRWVHFHKFKYPFFVLKTQGKAGYKKGFLKYLHI